jgi:hypothetical protein
MRKPLEKRATQTKIILRHQKTNSHNATGDERDRRAG